MKNFKNCKTNPLNKLVMLYFSLMVSLFFANCGGGKKSGGGAGLTKAQQDTIISDSGLTVDENWTADQRKDEAEKIQNEVKENFTKSDKFEALKSKIDESTETEISEIYKKYVNEKDEYNGEEIAIEDIGPLYKFLNLNADSPAPNSDGEDPTPAPSATDAGKLNALKEKYKGAKEKFDVKDEHGSNDEKIDTSEFVSLFVNGKLKSVEDLKLTDNDAVVKFEAAMNAWAGGESGRIAQKKSNIQQLILRYQTECIDAMDNQSQIINEIGKNNLGTYNLLIENNKFKEKDNLGLNLANYDSEYANYQIQVTNLAKFIKEKGGSPIAPLGPDLVFRNIENILSVATRLKNHKDLKKSLVKKILGSKFKSFVKNDEIITATEYNSLVGSNNLDLDKFNKFVEEFWKEKNVNFTKLFTGIYNLYRRNRFDGIYQSNIIDLLTQKEFENFINDIERTPSDKIYVDALFKSCARSESLVNLVLKFRGTGNEDLKYIFSGSGKKDVMPWLNEKLAADITIFSTLVFIDRGRMTSKQVHHGAELTKASTAFWNYIKDAKKKEYKYDELNSSLEEKEGAIKNNLNDLFTAVHTYITQLQKMLHYIKESDKNRTMSTHPKIDSIINNSQDIEVKFREFCDSIKITVANIQTIFEWLPKKNSKKVPSVENELIDSSTGLINYDDSSKYKDHRADEYKSAWGGLGSTTYYDYYHKNHENMKFNVNEYKGQSYEVAWQTLRKKLNELMNSDEYTSIFGLYNNRKIPNSTENRFLFAKDNYLKQLQKFEPYDAIKNDESVFYISRVRTSYYSSNHKILDVLCKVKSFLHNVYFVKNSLKMQALGREIASSK